tara:strand:- start:77 stop:721 length:645 start_codon:yes stop_codon:yes gene_type:complete
MPTWPTSTKASTSNVDSGSDKPRLAREDIKQNIENTNAIIDTLHISSPADQNVLVYNSSNARFELASQQFQECLLEVSNSVVSSNDLLAIDSKISDTQNICTIESNGHFTLIDGTYLIWIWTSNGTPLTTAQTISMSSQDLIDITGDPSSGGEATALQQAGTEVADGLVAFGKIIVGTGNRDGTFRMKHSVAFRGGATSGQITNETFLRILKVA